MIIFPCVVSRVSEQPRRQVIVMIENSDVGVVGSTSWAGIKLASILIKLSAVLSVPWIGNSTAQTFYYYYFFFLTVYSTAPEFFLFLSILQDFQEFTEPRVYVSKEKNRSIFLNPTTSFFLNTKIMERKRCWLGRIFITFGI